MPARGALLRPLRAFPTALPAGGDGRSRRTLDLAERTLRDAEASSVFALLDPDRRVAGLSGGALEVTSDGIFLLDYALTPGIALSGTLRSSGISRPLEFTGAITVGGRAAAPGGLLLRAGVLSGSLAGQDVSMRID